MYDFNTKRFFKDKLVLLPALTAAVAVAGCASLEPEAPPHVVFIVGEGEYESERTLPRLAQELEESHRLRTTVLIDRNIEDAWTPEPHVSINDIPGLEVLEEADLVFFYIRFRQLPQEQLDRIQAYLDSGRPVIGLRTTTHAFRYAEGDPRAEEWNQFGARVLGAPWIHHYGGTSRTVVTVVPEAAEHPILRGVEPEVEVRSWLYQVRPDYPPEAATVLLMGRSIGEGRGPEEERDLNPVAWTFTHPGGGRVFTTTLGHPDEFETPSFRRLLINAVHWALELPVPQPRLGS